MALKLSLRGLGCALAARERKCSSRVMIGLVVIDLGHPSEDPFNRADDGKDRVGKGPGARKRADLISERAGKTVESGILMMFFTYSHGRRAGYGKHFERVIFLDVNKPYKQANSIFLFEAKERLSSIHVSILGFRV
jgi:hypothetical protein